MIDKKVIDALIELASNPDALDALIELAKAGHKENTYYRDQPMIFGGPMNRHRGLLEEYLYGDPNPFKEVGGKGYCNAIIDVTADSVYNWFRHGGDGDMPVMDDVLVIVLMDHGGISAGRAEIFDWQLIKAYAIVKLPEYF